MSVNSAETPWLDITRPLYPGMPVWPGDPPVSETPVSRIAAGDNCNVSVWNLGSHCGTHIDPPLHFEAGGAAVHQMDINILCGPSRVLDLSNASAHITPNLLSDCGGDTRLIIKTRNSYADPMVFHEDFIAFTEDAAHWAVWNGIRLLGIDGPSIEPFAYEGSAVHHTLLQAGIIMVENLILNHVSAGRYELVCAPLPWRGGDGAPCRALLRRL